VDFGVVPTDSLLQTEVAQRLVAASERFEETLLC